MIPRLGWTLLHFLWQGTAIALVYAVLRRVFAGALSPRGHYALSCTTLALMATAPLLTFFALSGSGGIPSRGEGWNISSAQASHILPVLVFLWMAGVAVFSVRLFGAWRFTQRLRSISHPASAEWQQRLQEIGLRVAPAYPAHIRRVRVMISSLVDAPTVIGWLRPVIMSPVAFLSELPVSYVEALLAHELAHIRRHDYIASIVQNIIETVLFYHPAVWWISGQIRAERELCCDDLVVAATSDAVTYARALTSLESRQVARTGLQLAANGGMLLARIRRLLEPASARPNDLPGVASAWAMLLLWVLGAGVTAVHGAPKVTTQKYAPVAAPPDMASKPSPYSEPLLFDPVFRVQKAQNQPPALPAPPAVSRIAFEVADVHASAHSENPSLRVFNRNGRYELLGATMVDLISTAYGIPSTAVAGGPNWMERDRFDVIAKVPADPAPSPEELRAMLQTLLRGRFGLVTHSGLVPRPAYVLTAGKSPRLKKANGGDSGCENDPTDISPIFNGAYLCRNVTMAAFAEFLQKSQSSPILGYARGFEIVDKTGLQAGWDFGFRVTGRGLIARAGADAITLFDALDKQLGLRLEWNTVSLPGTLVDSVNEKPGPNTAAVSEKLPPLPHKFDVVDIKLSQDDKPSAPRFTAGGRMTVRGVALIALIQHAWGLDNYDNDLIVDGPKWLTTERFDIVAQAEPPEGPSSALKDDDTLREMLREMLIDRFALRMHSEVRPVDVLVLTADQTKLTKADTSERSKCFYSGATPPGPASAGLRTVICQNTSMAQFATGLHEITSGYAKRPAVDESGLDGGWDFSVTFSPVGVVTAMNQQRGEVGAASDPSGVVSFFEALEKIGLKFTTQKRPTSVWVIDHVEQQPDAN
ncbi:MAG TPA: M56 family metallopeptidase [Bryobacteraceae bacterium]|nr:M56 family metallopeptidase [Bryobacteraceae bacterium]